MAKPTIASGGTANTFGANAIVKALEQQGRLARRHSTCILVSGTFVTPQCSRSTPSKGNLRYDWLSRTYGVHPAPQKKTIKSRLTTQ
jgi:hypothetical protein